MTTRLASNTFITNPGALPITKQPADLNNDFVPVTSNSLTLGTDSVPIIVAHRNAATTVTLPAGITALGNNNAIRSHNGNNIGGNSQSDNVVIGHGNDMKVWGAESYRSSNVIIGSKCDTFVDNVIAIGYASKPHTSGTGARYSIGIGSNNIVANRNFNFHIGYNCRSSQSSGYSTVVGYRAKSYRGTDIVIGSYSKGSESENRTHGVLGSQSNSRYGSATMIGHKIVNGTSGFQSQRYSIVLGNRADISVGTAPNHRSIAIGYKATCNANNQLAINVSGTTTNSLRSTLTVTSQGTGVQPNPNTTKALPLMVQNTNFVVELFT